MTLVRLALSAAAAAALLTTAPAQPLPRPTARPRPKLEPVAETKLLMEGLLQSNFRGLEGHLKVRPADDTAWTFARGQALLIAETGNLLMLRPPRTAGQDAWMGFAIDLRDKATRLARTIAARDHDGGRLGLADLATTCNRCHQTFGQPARVVPFADPDG